MSRTSDRPPARVRARYRISPESRHFSVIERVLRLAVGQDVRDDDAFQRRVGAVDVEGRVGLGDAEVLRLREDVLVIESLGAIRERMKFAVPLSTPRTAVTCSGRSPR